MKNLYKAFDGLKTRSFDSQKKYLDRDAIAALENATEFIGTAKQNIWIYFIAVLFWWL
jgi:hypothetical protein